jgi:tRNA/tmRNA/rRNA uracil-C5-methylase (TrmA/RlmC/RlmD family)
MRTGQQKEKKGRRKKRKEEDQPTKNITTMSEVNSNNAANADASSKKSKNNKKRKNKSPQLQPGDPNYKTPTQLRNARKRRKTKTTKATTTSSGANFNNNNNNVIINNSNDPSLKYLSNPKIAPTVRNAIRFFRDKTCAPMGENHDTYFPVTVGPKIGWRHIARLAIQRRRKKKGTIQQQGGGSDSTSTNNNKKKPKSKTRIGLFVPGSHELLPVPDCPVHHRKINELVKVLEEECNDLNVPIFDNDDDITDDDKDISNGNSNSSDNNNTNKFGLRYVAVAVERSTQKQQLVLVWKEPDESENKNKNKPLNTLIKRLVKLSNATAKATDNNNQSTDNQNQNQKLIRLHSIWVHYNNSWKHSNSIFDRTGRWETKFVHDDDDNDIDAVTSKENNNNNDPLYGSIREVMLPTSINKLRVPLYFPPQVFRQANLDGFSKIIVNIREWLNEQLLLSSSLSSSSTSLSMLSSTKENDDEITLDSSKRKRRRGRRDTSTDISRKPTTTMTTTATLGHCLELYGGVGTIGLNLIDLFDSIESSDENPFNEKCFYAAADEITTMDDGSGGQQPINKSKRESITYITKSASDVVVDNYSSLQKARVVIVDPPRKGLDPPVIDALCRDYETSDNTEQQQQALIYVSCGFDAFRRDYEALVEKSGKWTLDRAEGKLTVYNYLSINISLYMCVISVVY